MHACMLQTKKTPGSACALRWQIPGRMSDSAVAGAGAYAETGVGGCGSTGDGDIHLRFLPCYQARPPPPLP